LTWDASTATDFSQYLLYRNTTTLPWTLIATPLINSYLDSNLTDNVRYFYKIAAKDDGGPIPNSGLNSTVRSSIPTDTTPPPQVTGVDILVLPEGNALYITWSPITGTPDFVAYWLYRNISTTLWTRLAILTVTYYQDTGLINNKTYLYKISAVDEVPNLGTNSTAKGAIPKDTTAPPAVTTLTVTLVPTGNTLNISWGLVSAPDIQEYRVYRDITSGFTPGPANRIAIVTHPLSFFVDTGLTDGQTYYYKVLSWDDDGNRLPEVIQKSGTPQDTVPPLQPTSFNVTNIGGSLYLNWTMSQESDFVKYEIWRNGSWILVQTIYNRMTNYWIDSSDNLFDTYSYLYELRIFDEVGYNSTAAAKLTNLIKPTGDITPPQNITTLVASNLGTAGNVRLTWTAPPDKDVMNYKVYRSRTAGFTPNLANLIGITTNTYFNDYDPILNGTGVTYYYKVRAADENDNTAKGGNEAFVAVYDQQRPISVFTFTATSGTDGQILLAWTASTPSDFQSYNIYRWLGLNLQFPTNPSTLIARITNNNTLFYIDNESNLIDGQLYTYKIAIADEVGDSPTKYATGFTSGDNDPPTAPTGLIVRNEGTGDILNLTWNKNLELDIHHYRVYRNSTFIANASTNFYQDRGLIEYRTYIYYITAVDEAQNEGTASTIASGIPIDIKAPSPPTVIEPVSKSGRTAILIIRTPSDLDVLYYNIYRSNVSGFTPNNSTLIALYWPKTGEFTTYLDPDLEIGVYYYKVVALDEKYQASLSSNEARISITLYAPVWVTITDNANGDLTLKWQDNSTNTPYSVIGWYRIYRMNASNPILIYIGNVSSLSVYPVTYQYIDYGLPNGNWTYYLTTVDKFFGESALSKAYSIFVNDIVPPGAPAGLNNITRNGLPNVTISWTRPANPNNGSDVFRYEIYISRTPISNLTGLLPNATIYGFGWHPDKTIRDLYYPLTSYTFYNLSDDTYYFVVIAYDENNYSSSLSNMISYIVDTTKPTIYEYTLQRPSQLLVGKVALINITLYDRYGIASVYIRYTTDGLSYFTSSMSILASFPNGTRIYSGPIAGQEAGRTVSFTINVIDSFGNSRTSSSFSYQIVGEETPWTMIIVAIAAIAAGAVAGAMVITRMRAKGKKKEYVAEELLPLPI